MTACVHEWEDRGPVAMFGAACEPLPARYCPKCGDQVCCEGGFDAEDRPIPTIDAGWVGTRRTMTRAEFNKEFPGVTPDPAPAQTVETLLAVYEARAKSLSEHWTGSGLMPFGPVVLAFYDVPRLLAALRIALPYALGKKVVGSIAGAVANESDLLAALRGEGGGEVGP